MKMNQEKVSESPVFIVGVPRSGTTLVSSMLSAHPNIAISPETHFLNNWAKPNLENNLSSKQDIDSFWDCYSHSDRFSHLGLDANCVEAGFISTVEEFGYKAIFSTILQEYAHKLDKRRWGEKTPSHYLHIDTLLEWYPQARIIWMLRDPRSVVASLMKVDWASSYTHVNAKLWRDSAILFEKKWVEDNRVKLVKYESLVTDAENQLRKLCDFINEEYCPSMLEGRSSENSPIVNRSGWAKSYLQQTLRPVDQNSLKKWKTALSSSQIAIIEYICYTEMIKNGYSIEIGELTLLQMFAFLMSKASHKIEHQTKGLVQGRKFYL